MERILCRPQQTDIYLYAKLYSNTHWKMCYRLKIKQIINFTIKNSLPSNFNFNNYYHLSFTHICICAAMYTMLTTIPILTDNTKDND